MEPQTYALIGVAVTAVLFLLGGAFALGKLFQRVDTLTTDLTRVSTDLTRLSADVRQLAGEVRRTNEFVIALANHRHDVDGNTVFTVPDAGG
jgi:outer membrane murein-binding lipoprotein Lpp